MQSFDTLCEVQSDKASVEITSPFDGVVKQLLVQEGEIAKVGAGLCLIEVEQEDDGGHDPQANQDASATPEPIPEGTHDPAVSVEGSETSSWERSEMEEDAEVSVPRTDNKHPLDPTSTGSTSSTSDHALATPSVRHFARQHSVDIAALAPGSGRDGRVEKKDVEAFIARGRVVLGVEAESASQVARTENEDVVVELGRTRYGMWKAMTQVRRWVVSLLARLTIPSILLPEPRDTQIRVRVFVWASDDDILTSTVDTLPR